jgi:hypothetical protein
VKRAPAWAVKPPLGPSDFNEKLPKWLRDLDKPAIERAVGMPLGAVLGCGHWGCVIASTPPWVIKLTRDPTEGPIWAKIVGWTREQDERTNGLGTEGVVRVKDIVRLRPDVQFRGKTFPLHAIVREEAIPLLGGGAGLGMSLYTMELLGFNEAAKKRGLSESEFYYVVPDSLRRWADRHPDLPLIAGNARELADLLHGLEKYRDAATAWHHQHELKRPQPYKINAAEDNMQAAIGHMSGWIGNAIGETLGEMLSDGLVLRDVHWGNIGWRIHPERPGDEFQQTLVIYDPGHTPTETQDVREALRENVCR